MWLLGGERATQAIATYDYTVIPILELGDSESYLWLGGSLVFEFPKRVSHLVEVSMIVFEGPPLDPQKRPPIRVEWACQKGYVKDRHAQPHWHIYQTELAATALAEYQFDEEVGRSRDFSIEVARTADAEAYSWPDQVGERFHFAMASRWHLVGEATDNDALSLDGLEKWLSGCLRYTLAQLRYVYHRV